MASIFSGDDAKRIDIVNGGGSLAFVLAWLLGLMEGRKMTLALQYGSTRESHDHEIVVGCTRPLANTDCRLPYFQGYEIWGNIINRDHTSEAFHGIYKINGRGCDKGWIEPFETWLFHDSILACPNVFAFPGITVLTRHHESYNVMKPEQHIGWAKHLGNNSPPTEHPKQKRYTLYQLFKIGTNPGSVLAFPCREVTFDPTDCNAYQIDDNPHVIV